jgi:glycine cleavage system H protein
MVIILVAAMFVIFAVVGAWRQKVIETRVALAAKTPVRELRFHPGHAWLANVGPGLVKVGLDELAASLAGIPDGLRVPGVGTRIRQGEESLVVACGDRRLQVTSPVTGRVVAINPETVTRPAAVAEDPYGRGWALLVRPHGQGGASNLLSGSAARQWIDALRGIVANMVAPPVAVTAYDAGPLRMGFGQDLSDEQFHQLKREFFTSTE